MIGHVILRNVLSKLSAFLVISIIVCTIGEIIEHKGESDLGLAVCGKK